MKCVIGTVGTILDGAVSFFFFRFPEPTKGDVLYCIFVAGPFGRTISVSLNHSSFLGPWHSMTIGAMHCDTRPGPVKTKAHVYFSPCECCGGFSDLSARPHVELIVEIKLPPPLWVGLVSRLNPVKRKYRQDNTAEAIEGGPSSRKRNPCIFSLRAH